VSTEQESIGDYVRRVAKEKGLTFREVARRAGLSSPTISDIVSGKTKQVKSSTITSLAKGLDVPEEEVFDVVRGASKSKNGFDESEFALYHSKLQKLTAQQKRDFKIFWQAAKDAIDRMEREKNNKTNE
jgi:transcriptional regulator with XRE-family HTH domain